MFNEERDMNRINVEVGGTYVPFFLGCDDVAEDFIEFCTARGFDYYTEIVTNDEAKAIQEKLSWADLKIKDTLLTMFAGERNV